MTILTLGSIFSSMHLSETFLTLLVTATYSIRCHASIHYYSRNGKKAVAMAETAKTLYCYAGDPSQIPAQYNFLSLPHRTLSTTSCPPLQLSCYNEGNDTKCKWPVRQRNGQASPPSVCEPPITRYWIPALLLLLLLWLLSKVWPVLYALEVLQASGIVLAQWFCWCTYKRSSGV